MNSPFTLKDWKETEATVYTCGWKDHFSLNTGIAGEYLIVFSYEIDGEWYSGEFTSPRPWEEGSTFTIKYDPSDPQQNNFS